MNREIKFRGLRSDGQGWVYGSLLRGYEAIRIVYDSYDDDYAFAFANVSVEVTPESVGQFTGLYDKNGKEIYEGDKTDGGEVVVFEEGIFGTTYIGNQQGVSRLSEKRCLYLEITGNIHDK